MSSTVTSSAVHGVGTFVWAALLRSQARLANPLFAEFLPDVGRERRGQSADAARALAIAKAPVQNVLQDILHILHNVLGRAVDASEPLMEVPLQDLACILCLLLAAGCGKKLIFGELLIRLIEIKFLLNPNMCPVFLTGAKHLT